MKNMITLVLLSIFSTVGCNFKHNKVGSDLGDLGNITCEPVLFSTINQNIFVNGNCTSCHGVQFDSYEKIKTQFEALKIWLPKMPKVKPQSPANLALFDQWVRQGFPQTVDQANLSVCGSPTPKPPVNGGTIDPNPPPAVVCENTYRDIADNVLTPRCVGCHGIKGGVNLESYSEVKANLKGIQSELEFDDMPPVSPLTPEQKDKLLHWIASGAPEFSSDPGCESKPPVVMALEPNFKSLNEKIFVNRCTVCHNSNMTAAKLKSTSPNHQGEGFDFSSYDKIKSYGSELFNFAQPEKSRIVRVIAKGNMPPPSTSFKPLTLEELEVLTQWIRLGLPKE